MRTMITDADEGPQSPGHNHVIKKSMKSQFRHWEGCSRRLPGEGRGPVFLIPPKPTEQSVLYYISDENV
jgi:hypothetical protein